MDVLKDIDSAAACSKANALEAKVLDYLVHHAGPDVLRDPGERKILWAPWVHYFVHFAYGRWLAGAEHALQDPVTPYAPPGDTLALREALRQQALVDRFDSTLRGCAPSDAPPYRRSPEKLAGIERHGSAEAVMYLMRFPRWVGYIMPLLCWGRVRNQRDRRVPYDVGVDSERRDQLYRGLRDRLAGEACGAWLAARAVECLPLSLLEGASARITEFQERALPQRLYCANAFDVIDDWRLYALACRARGAKLIGSPHAVNHGLARDFWPREFEFAAFDGYLTWGWSSELAPRAKPFYCPLFVGRRRPRRLLPLAQRREVLITAAGRPRHVLEFPHMPADFERYLREQQQLAQAVAARLSRAVVVRTRPRDLGWDLTQWYNQSPESLVRLEFQKGQFLDRLRTCRVHICDNTSTAIIESLWANHPTVVVLSDVYFHLSKEGADACAELAAAGVFHRTMDSAVAHLKRIDVDPDSWWRSDAVQRAVDAFLTREGRFGVESLWSWRGMLMDPQLPWSQGVAITAAPQSRPV